MTTTVQRPVVEDLHLDPNGDGDTPERGTRNPLGNILHYRFTYGRGRAVGVWRKLS